MDTPKDYYETNGYYVFRNLIPESLINNILKEYNSNILSSNSPFFRQSTNKWETNTITPNGYSEESFRDVHDYPDYPGFTEAAKEVFCLQQVREALTELTGSKEHNLMQTMFFDMNTATPAHQDWYYLDSMPNGHLLAGWFALEDIHEEAGRFYVLPTSHLVDFELTDDEKLSNRFYLEKLKEYINVHKSNIQAPALKKGDVLFWNSRTIHGSLETLNPQYSRKSLTAHYLPAIYEFGSRNAESPTAVDYATYKGMKYRLIPAMYKNYSAAAKLKTDLLQYLWEQPKLMRTAKFVRKVLQGAKGK
ncbi:phytanoyl-CoA dioxygenase family protein [Coleofasciculus sp. FACHB-SPT36]|uniref:phytanoyl-CoA dioxygenase family protein n=1 Tax=Cyanophyceae TaxID=3028117 RepID=UPI00168A5847|nr:phytanoyl-CoA dioxygenase family protein [Coleofasciculus sp. FACHB-SPT36]MBD2538907.1 phytanoyl-CoA dioxygenase family protein [Coleofasciculus sp. FACHB-SPT36]